MTTYDKITKNQHYIPRIYLKGFSDNKATVYGYRVTDNFEPPKDVSIESICAEKYLYEMVNEDNKLVWPNHLEKILAGIEKLFEIYMHKLERKAFISSNYSSLCFFTKKEKHFWKSYIALQIMRMPEMISMVENEIKRNNDVISENELHALALVECLPFFSKELDTNYLIFDIRKVLDYMSIALGVDETESIITSDNPIVKLGPDYDMENLEKIEFPLTSKLVLFLFGGKLKEEYRKNSLFPLLPDEVKTIKRNIAYSTNEWIYSKRPLSEEEKEIIREAHNLKIENDE